MSLEKKAWHIAFLVRDYPKSLRTIGPSHFNSTIDDAFLSILRETKKRAILNFLSQDNHERFIWVAFLIEAENLLDATIEARHRMDGLIDGASFWGDNRQPEVSDFLWAAEADEHDAHIFEHRRELWLETRTPSDESRSLWNRRNGELRKRVTRFFTLALDTHSNAKTPLARQIRHSMRMFRHGKQSGSWGVEFICKFCALEGLICGDEKSRKKQKFSSRLSALFSDKSPQFNQRVDRLWRCRNEAVHTARAFAVATLDEGDALVHHLSELEHFFAGALVFAMEKIDTTTEVAELWQNVSDFTLPDLIRIDRPRDLPKYAVPDLHVSTGFCMPGGGLVLKQYLSEARSKHGEPHPKQQPIAATAVSQTKEPYPDSALND